MYRTTELISSEAIAEALTRLEVPFELVGPVNLLTGVAPISCCAAGNLVWSRAPSIDPSLIPASVFLLQRQVAGTIIEAGDKTLFFVDSPRDAFRMILLDLFKDQVRAAKGLNDPALFAEALNGQGVCIAEGVRIGENVVLHPNVVIYPNVVIGNDVEIGAGTVIGAPGYSYIRQPDGTLQHFPHIGGVVIGNQVTIGANCGVDSGGLGPTQIGRGTKIGNLCQIAHNVQLGEDCLIAGRVQIGGSTFVGDRTEIWPSSVIANKLTVGKGCDIKIGSVVVKNVPDGASVSGNFAVGHDKTLREFARKRR